MPTPNADFLWKVEAQKQSFLLSNMAPQMHEFNDGIWGDLEDLSRVWATNRGEIYIVAGPLFEGTARKPIGKDKVAVPSHFFKIIYDPATKEALAFVFVHAQTRTGAFSHFKYTVREVEKRVDLDFLNALPKTLEDKVETSNTPVWDADLKAWKAAKKAKCSH